MEEVIKRIEIAEKKLEEILKLNSALDTKVAKFMNIKKKKSAKEFFITDYTPEIYPFLEGKTLEDKFNYGVKEKREIFVKLLKERSELN